MEIDIEGYAALMVELAAAGEGREEVLARHGLDEDRWAEIDTHFQEQLSAAMDEEGDGVGEAIARYAAAYEAAQRAQGPAISVELFARVTRLLEASGDLRAALARAGVTLAQFVQASEHWSRRIVEDPEVEQRFRAALAGHERERS